MSSGVLQRQLNMWVVRPCLACRRSPSSISMCFLQKITRSLRRLRACAALGIVTKEILEFRGERHSRLWKPIQLIISTSVFRGARSLNVILRFVTISVQTLLTPESTESLKNHWRERSERTVRRISRASRRWFQNLPIELSADQLRPIERSSTCSRLFSLRHAKAETVAVRVSYR